MPTATPISTATPTLERDRDCESGHDRGRERAWDRRSNSMPFQKLDVHVAAKEIARLLNDPALHIQNMRIRRIALPSVSRSQSMSRS
jgi:hypothetical protein